MRTEAIHRIIEEQAAVRGDDQAIVAPDFDVSYRELNGRANALARQFVAAGLRRCGHGVVTQAPRPDVIVTLLAILKTGAAYSWERPEDSSVDVPVTESVSIRSAVGGTERCRLPLVTQHDDPRTQPNLPVLTRGSDIACVLPGRSPLLIPHGTVSALHANPAVHSIAWEAEEGTIGIWLTLMSGRPVTVGNLLHAPAA